MGLSKKHFKIAEILAAFFTGSQTEQDEREFREWQEAEESNKTLADQLLKRGRYEENRKTLERFPAKEAWEDVDKLLDRNVKRIFPWKQVMRYAAVILVLLSTGLFYWWNSESVKENTPVLVRQIVAGTTGARLTLGDGRTVDIVKDQKLELLEADGTKIMTDSLGIDYSVKESEDKPEVLNKVQTLTGMEYSLTLSDGTKVYLNAESKLEFPTQFKGKQRVVKLEGEAYFDVNKDPDHPFIVEMGSLKVKVLGTSFNLRSYGDEDRIVTTLVEGKVEVSSSQASLTITPGMQVIYRKDQGDMELQEVDVTLYTSWQSGKFVFRNESLSNVMAYLSKWYGFEYRFIDEQAKKVQIGARVDRYNNMDPIIEMLRRTGLVKVTRVDNMFYISSAK